VFYGSACRGRLVSKKKLQGSPLGAGESSKTPVEIRATGDTNKGIGIMPVGVTREFRAIIDGGTVAGLPDGELLKRFASGRGAEAELAFAALVMRHGPLVFGVCQSLLRNRHDAEDAFQAAFLVLARKAGSIRQPDRLGPWLYGVAHRTARRLKEKNARRKSHEAEVAVSSDRAHRSSGSSPHPSAPADHDAIEALHREIGRLPARYQTAVVLCDLQGLTHEEAARRLGCPVGTMSSRVSRARERLRRRLDRRGLAYPSGIVAAAVDSTRPSVLPNVLVGSTVKNVMSLSTGLAAGSVPVSIVSLHRGVLRSMLFARIRLISAALVGLGAAATGVGVGVGAVGRAPQPATQQLAPGRLVLDPEPIAVAVPVPGETGEAESGSDRETELIVRSATNVKRIAGAIHAHLDANNGNFPAAAIVDPDGTPLLSWRVAILPYLGESEKALYGQFNLTEPWDSTHNKALLAKMPKVYAPAVAKGGEKDKYVTHYLGLVGGGALFERDRVVNLNSVTDGTSNTLMIAEAVTGVPWTKPEDLAFTGRSLLPQLGSQFEEGFVGVTADGVPRLFKKSLNPTLLVEIITRGGGEVVDLSDAGEGVQIP
jgi:RNA polymerase sigma factor (sigma-70 family)